MVADFSVPLPRRKAPLRTEPWLFYAAGPSLAFNFLVALIQSLLKFLSRLLKNHS
jgi:hypothetical protein